MREKNLEDLLGNFEKVAQRRKSTIREIDDVQN